MWHVPITFMPCGCPACHTGERTCFYRGDMEPTAEEALPALERTIADRKAAADTASSYTARLLGEGPSRIAQKVGEEGVELALAGASGERDACIAEAADLIYHITVLMEARGFGWNDVAEVLRGRHG